MYVCVGDIGSFLFRIFKASLSLSYFLFLKNGHAHARACRTLRRATGTGHRTSPSCRDNNYRQTNVTAVIHQIGNPARYTDNITGSPAGRDPDRKSPAPAGNEGETSGDSQPCICQRSVRMYRSFATVNDANERNRRRAES